MKLPPTTARQAIIGAPGAPRRVLPPTPNERAARITPAVDSIAKLCLQELTFDDLIWGSFADHFAAEGHCREKAEKVLTTNGKAQHTVFCLDKRSREGLRQEIIAANKRKGGWIDNPPHPERTVISLGTKLGYYTCTATAGGGADCDHGVGYPEVKVRADAEDLREATKQQRCPTIDFYTPYHLQGVDYSP